MMIAVNLDDIIHYRPPASKHPFTPPQASGFLPHYPSPSASYLTQSIFPSSVHSRGLPDHAQNLQFATSHSSGETQYSPFNTGLPKQSAIENSKEFDKELLNSNTARKDSLVKSDMYSMDGEAQNGSIRGNGGRESHGPCNGDFQDDAEDGLLEPILQPDFEDPALWKDIGDSSPVVEFYSSTECPGSVAEFPAPAQVISSQADLNPLTDQAAVDVVVAQVSACDKMENSMVADEKNSMSMSRDNVVRQGNSLSHRLDYLHEAAKDNLHPSTCGCQRESADTENPSSNQPVTGNEYITEEARAHAATSDNNKVLGHHDDGSHAMSYQFDANKTSLPPPPVQQHDGPASRAARTASPEAQSRSSLPSAVVGPRSRESRTKGVRLSCPGKGKDRPPPHCCDDSDDPDSPNDQDYTEESGDDVCQGVSHPAKKPRRAAAARVTPARVQYEAACRSPAVVTQADVSVDQGCSSTSLHDIETIPIRGFLTRQIFLSRVVYSFTIEEQRENSCFHGSGEVPEHRRESRHSKAIASKKSRIANTSKGTRFLPEDDKLLIELKEERNLPWSRIVEYFPGRSKGALQVRYSTKLKDRGIKSRRQKPNTTPQSPGTSKRSPRKAFDLCQGSRTASGRHVRPATPRQRYGPTRTRRVVDRFSPV